MKMVEHPNIVNLIEVIDDPDQDHFYMGTNQHDTRFRGFFLYSFSVPVLLFSIFKYLFLLLS